LSASASLFFKDPAQARFLSGGLAEAEALFGRPLPPLPPGELQEGREVYFVRFSPKLRPLLVPFLKGALAQVGVQFAELSAKADVRARDLEEYEKALVRTLASVRATDRRLGLANLFWLATSREVALALREIEAKNPQVKKAKYQVPPLLAQFYRRVDQSVRKELDKQAPESVAALTRAGENTSLSDAILDDGLALTEVGIADLDVAALLRENRRYRISADALFELQGILAREVERRMKDGDKGLQQRLARHAPGVPKEQQLTGQGTLKLAFNPQVMTYLLADVWGTGSHLLASHRLKSEAERINLPDAFLEFVGVLKRFELIADIRDRVLPVDADLEDKVRRGLRLYDFGESTQVLNNAVNATVLFLDLRGFTKTSEGQISERDLTRELYAVFDAFVPHVLRFGGSIDKFLGDGMMIHYGTAFADPAAPLNALRTAILCQETIQRLRREGRTQYKMGVSIHYGRVYLARFIADDQAIQNTIIGRNVNLAGRLSSAAKKPMEEDEQTSQELGGPSVPVRSNELAVTVDGAGSLFNEGIAVSRAAFVQIEPQVELREIDQAGVRLLQFFDSETKRNVRFRYAGDAKFKGVKASFPVFEVDYEA
jgi:class 3 adenylate cyclase